MTGWKNLTIVVHLNVLLSLKEFEDVKEALHIWKQPGTLPPFISMLFSATTKNSAQLE